MIRGRKSLIAWELLEPRRVLASLGFTPHTISGSVGPIVSTHVADMDGDGDMDVLSAGNRLSWFRNNGQGGFGAQRTISDNLGSFVDVVAADLDGDGDLDVLSASANNNEVAWYENTDGVGKFSAQRVITTDALRVQSVYAGDVDGDGHVDVLSASFDDDKIAWYRNIDGEGTFGTQQVITTSADGATAVFAADLDQDGDLDVLSSSARAGTIAWHPNVDGHGTFGEMQILTDEADGAADVYAADLDGDGDLDVLTASATDDVVAWHENTDGSGTFGRERVITTMANGVIDLYAADLDGDGDLDVLSASTNDYYSRRYDIAWYENTDGAGTFEGLSGITSQAQRASSVYAADFDGDGDLDVLSSSYGIGGNGIAWYEASESDLSFSDPRVIIEPDSSGPQVADTADLDGDGDLDLLTASQSGVAWYENTDGSGNFGPQREIVTWNGPLGRSVGRRLRVLAADVDGDGDQDVLLKESYEDKIAWYENTDGQGNFGPEHVITQRADHVSSISAGDLDGDGDLDVLATSVGTPPWFTESEVAWYENTDGAGNFRIHVITNQLNHPWTAVVDDLDDDGDLDVIVSWYWGGEGGIGWFENTDGMGAFGPQRLIDENSGPINLRTITDLDGDGDRDVLATSSGESIDWYENNGEGNFGERRALVTLIDDYVSVVFAGDVDDDGDVDLLTLSRVFGFPVYTIAWLENLDGAATFGPRRVISQFDPRGSNVTVIGADLDSDGDLDVISTSPADNTVAWYENVDRVGNFGAPHVLTSPGAAGVRTVASTDLDGDGDLDAIAASTLGTAWYENVDGLGTFGPQRVISEDSSSLLVPADLDGDGDMDVLSAGTTTAWSENLDGRGTFGPQHGIDQPNDSTSVDSIHTVDLDSDGDLDILSMIRVRSSSEYVIAWNENSDGTGTFGPAREILRVENGARSIAMGDLDGDGDLDLLLAISPPNADRTISWYEKIDGTVTFGPSREIVKNDVLPYPDLIQTADIDNDGDLDVVASSPSYRWIAWYENRDGQGSFGPHRVITQEAFTADDWDLADLDNDGDLDVVSALRSEDKITWCENLDGRGTYGPQFVITQRLNSPLSITAADLDGDGDLDLLSGFSGDSTIAWYENLFAHPGDANRDGAFDSSDLVQVFVAGEYEDDVEDNSTWEEGDWNGDGDFDSADLVAAMQTGLYERKSGSVAGVVAAAVDWLFAEEDRLRRREAFVA